MDTSNFDKEFTSEAPTDSVTEGSQLTEAMQQQFKGFTFVQTEAIAGSLASGSVMNANHMVPTSRQPGGMRK
jgi:serum/glucocorticoid-regulated kinase 2